MRINLTIEEEDIERIVKALDTQYAYTRAKQMGQYEDSNYKRLADLFRQFLKRGPGPSGANFALTLRFSTPVSFAHWSLLRVYGQVGVEKTVEFIA